MAAEQVFRVWYANTVRRVIEGAKLREVRAAFVTFVITGIVYFAIWPFWNPSNDFLHFYAGAQLVRTPEHLYSVQHAGDIQQSVLPGEPMIYPVVRPAFYYAIMSRLAALPYKSALGLWQALSVAAILGFVVLWSDSRHLTLGISGLFIPVWYGLARAQDANLYPFAIAASAWLIATRHPFAAGAMLSVCAAKPHIFLLLPIILLTESRRFASGFILSCCLLYAASVAVLNGSWLWPVTHLRYLESLYGSASISPALLAVTAATLLVMFKRRDWEFRQRIALVCCASLVVAQRPLFYDSVTLLPLLTYAVESGRIVVPLVLVGIAIIAWHLYSWPATLPVVAVFLMYCLFVPPGRGQT